MLLDGLCLGGRGFVLRLSLGLVSGLGFLLGLGLRLASGFGALLRLNKGLASGLRLLSRLGLRSLCRGGALLSFGLGLAAGGALGLLSLQAGDARLLGLELRLRRGLLTVCGSLLNRSLLCLGYGGGSLGGRLAGLSLSGCLLLGFHGGVLSQQHRALVYGLLSSCGGPLGGGLLDLGLSRSPLSGCLAGSRLSRRLLLGFQGRILP